VCCCAVQYLLQQPPLHQHGRGQRRLCAGEGQGLCVWRVPGAAGWRAGACAVSRTPGGGEVRVPEALHVFHTCQRISCKLTMPTAPTCAAWLPSSGGASSAALLSETHTY
jgi:hypothetical protein